MELIIDFYKGLDTLNLIIFWGIIIVIILLLIFSFIMLNKNKKLKQLVENNSKTEEDLPIKEQMEIIDEHKNYDKQESDITLTEIPEEETQERENVIPNNIEEENNFNVEELVIGYNHQTKQNINIQNESLQEEIEKSEKNIKQPIQMPTGPYQRNVLREMSLSQTSPIGINRQVRVEDKKVEIAKDLEESLNNDKIDNSPSQKEIVKINTPEDNVITEEDIKRDFRRLDNYSPRKTAIINELSSSTVNKNNRYETPIREMTNLYTEEYKSDKQKKDSTPKELLNVSEIFSESKTEKSSSEKYLEEVSKKLSEAEIPDEIERTNYELQQEEDAIISYKELMEKKDSIQMIDEEDAIISIEELINRSHNTQEEKPLKEDTKLYNLTETEENDNFIKELKEFRNDL